MGVKERKTEKWLKCSYNGEIKKNTNENQEHS